MKSEKLYTERELEKKIIEYDLFKQLDVLNDIINFFFTNWENLNNKDLQVLLFIRIQNLIKYLNKKEDISDGYHTFAELYDYRRAYNAMLVNEYAKQGLYNVHKSWKHNDGQKCFGGGWFVVQMDLPTGQISNHYEAKHWNEFQCEEREVSDAWDGHTPQEALERMIKFLNK